MSTHARAPARKPKGRDRFFEPECWGVTNRGNPTIVISVRGWRRRVVLFQQTETLLWRWLIMVEDGYEEFSQDSCRGESEARFDAWEAMQWI
jgi:hypothetical protein